MALRCAAVAARGLVVSACLAAISGCSSLPRTPFTPEEQAIATIPGIPGARLWADDPAIVRSAVPSPVRMVSKQYSILALSGGGADGAFGAGLLSGWSERGSRPEFTIVTGTSAGALIAPFAFLGPRYDYVLQRVFKDGEAGNLLQSAGLSGLFGAGLYKGEPLRALIASYIDDAFITAVGQEYLKGRRLYVVTTNLDSQRTAIWDMGRIAASGEPQAPALFREVLAASASVPGVFPPALIDVQAEGKRFAEMHVDGGITANVLIVPEAFLLSNAAPFPAGAKPTIYVILNQKLAPYFEVTKPETLPVAIRAFQTSVRANTRNTLIAAYEFAKRKNQALYVAAVEADYPSPSDYSFNAAYMNGLFQYAYERALKGELWQGDPIAPRAPTAGRKLAGAQ